MINFAGPLYNAGPWRHYTSDVSFFSILIVYPCFSPTMAVVPYSLFLYFPLPVPSSSHLPIPHIPLLLLVPSPLFLFFFKKFSFTVQVVCVGNDAYASGRYLFFFVCGIHCFCRLFFFILIWCVYKYI